MNLGPVEIALGRSLRISKGEMKDMRQDEATASGPAGLDSSEAQPKRPEM